MTRFVGIYLGAETIRRDSGYLDALRDGIGLTHVIVSGQVRLTEAVLALNPFGGGDRAARLRELSARRLDGSPLVVEDESAGPLAGRGPGISHGDDDSALREAIALCRERGLATWICLGSWAGRAHMYCPSQPAVNDWLAAAYADIATRYDLDCIDLTHARFPMFGVPHGLELCACDACARAAGELGYDLPRVVASLRGIPERVGRLSAASLAALIDANIGLPEVLMLLGPEPGLQDWLNLRADIITRQLGRQRDTVKAAVTRPFLFGSDAHPPGVALIAGHRYADWPRHSDWTTPLLSHIAAFLTWGFAAWAERLVGAVPGLSEAAALRLVYRLTGYDDLGMPRAIADHAHGGHEGDYRNVPIGPLMERDLLKARLYAPRSIPSYPIVMGGIWPRDTVRRLVEYAAEIGHDGIIFQQSEALIDYRPTP